MERIGESERREYMKSHQWRELRHKIFARDRYHCRECGKMKVRGMQVHHLTYERWKHEELDDLILICRTCHEKIHGIIKEVEA